MNSRYSQEPQHPPYYLLTGLILGLLFGFGVSFLFFPVRYTNVPPETLQNVDKDQYRLMIASAYQANNDIGRAQARLGILREENVSGLLLQQAQRSERRSDAQLLLKLSQALEKVPEMAETGPPIAQASITLSQSQTNTPLAGGEMATDQPVRTATMEATRIVATRTPFPSPSSVSSLNIPFRLVEQKTICNPAYTDTLIQVEVVDKKEKPISNVRIFVNWDGGQDIFYTGFFPEISIGYADFSMNPQETYSLRVGEIGEVIQNISAPECQDGAGKNYWGSISLLFAEP
ncbi:MAG: hypothetical protein BGO78_08210 [Chloroflexi bacterium 44-23]|nr:MAG: hypothetical protein BGO78_08210 [Chloroflexi bacterium 44-23]